MRSFRRAMFLATMGGAAFVFPFFGGPDLGCVRNSDLVTFYQNVGGASIAAFADSASGTVGNDFDAMVVTPTQTLFTAMWNNWVAQQIPLDVDPTATNLLRQ